MGDRAPSGMATPERLLSLLEPTAEELALIDTLEGDAEAETKLRFLRGRDHRVDKAQDFLNAHLEWRTKFDPGALALTDVEVAFRAGHGRFMGHGKNGEPI